MSDDAFVIALILVFFDEFGGPGKGDLINVFFDFLSRHPDSVV